jgi:hypothetical protein
LWHRGRDAFLVVGDGFAEELEAVAVRVVKYSPKPTLWSVIFTTSTPLAQQRRVEPPQLVDVALDLQAVVLQPEPALLGARPRPGSARGRGACGRRTGRSTAVRVR